MSWADSHADAPFSSKACTPSKHREDARVAPEPVQTPHLLLRILPSLNQCELQQKSFPQAEQTLGHEFNIGFQSGKRWPSTPQKPPKGANSPENGLDLASLLCAAIIPNRLSNSFPSCTLG
ncbi:MAG: hypothetical protein CBE00_03645 [Planctomycetaceae bacterium TMED240]|nr:hypothetical protein [Rhodopirellula sp.]OUX07755.1 MAG: hypothetical protein CBE00_03645 [Planctomycetaceae bacterium TMED240]